MITETEYKLLKNMVIAEFPVWNAFYAIGEEKWKGWKPLCIDDVYRCIAEKFALLEKDKYENVYLNLEGMCSSGGFTGGFLDGHIFICWAFESVCFRNWLTKEEKSNTPLTIGDVKKYSYIYSEIDCVEFLRMYKIYKLWQNKDKEITTITQTTSSAQG